MDLYPVEVAGSPKEKIVRDRKNRPRSPQPHRAAVGPTFEATVGAADQIEREEMAERPRLEVRAAEVGALRNRCSCLRTQRRRRSS